MDCHEAQECILEALTGQGGAGASACQHHIAGCETCAAFATMQRSLDARLTAALPPPCLSPDFRGSLKRAIRREISSAWPGFLLQGLLRSSLELLEGDT
jgi:hypothetical protein